MPFYRSLGKCTSTIELDTAMVTKEQIEELEFAVNEKIRECVPVAPHLYHDKNDPALANVSTASGNLPHRFQVFLSFSSWHNWQLLYVHHLCLLLLHQCSKRLWLCHAFFWVGESKGFAWRSWRPCQASVHRRHWQQPMLWHPCQQPLPSSGRCRSVAVCKSQFMESPLWRLMDHVFLSSIVMYCRSSQNIHKWKSFSRCKKIPISH